jgi:two-component system, OmpR family, manganese sensing sensor histidine kinase
MALAYPEAEPQLQQRQLQIIERLTQKLGRLVNDLLFLARADSGIAQLDWQPVPLDALLIDVIEEQRIVATQKGLFLSLRIIEPEIMPEKLNQNLHEEDIFTVQGDWDYLSRLFTNLIANAIEHSDQKEIAEASVEVELALIKPTSKPLRVREPHIFYELEVKIKDKGQGIPEAALPHIFDRFYRGDPARSSQRQIDTPTGAGLGLAIAKAIVENHQGNITVESVLEQGTIFTIILPKSRN